MLKSNSLERLRRLFNCRDIFDKWGCHFPTDFLCFHHHPFPFGKRLWLSVGESMFYMPKVLRFNHQVGQWNIPI